MEERPPQTPEPVCTCRLVIDGCVVLFVSEKQKQRFLQLRTCKRPNGQTVMIHGFQAVKKNTHGYFYEYTRLDEKVGKYNYHADPIYNLPKL